MTAATPEREGPGRWTALVAVVALLAACAAWANAFANDDIALIFDNARTHDLGMWRSWFTQPFWPPPFSPDLYRPLTLALLSVQYAFGSGDPGIFRLVSIALYVAASVGVFTLCRRLMPTRAAVVAACLFAAHPVHSEAVALAVGQAELIVGLIAVVMACRYIDARRAGRLGSRTLATLIVLYTIACFTKEQGLTIPALLLACELCLDGSLGERARSTWRFYGAAAIVALVVVFVRRVVLGDFAGTFTAEALVGLGIGGRALTMLGVVPQWARLLLWPAHLRGDYSPGEIVAATSFGPAQALGLVIILAVVAAAIAAYRRAPVVTLGLVWMAIGFAPVSNVIVPTGIVLAERTLFLPSVGFVIVVVESVRLLLARAVMTRSIEQGVLAATAIVVLLGVGRSMERMRVWRNEGYFVARTVQDAPTSFRMQQALGDLLFGAGRPDLARQAYDRALTYAPPAVSWRVHNSYARALHSQNDFAAEATQLRSSLDQRPDQELARARLVAAYIALGRYADARTEAESAGAHTANASIFRRLATTADSASRASAPAGTVRVSLGAGDISADRLP